MTLTTSAVVKAALTVQVEKECQAQVCGVDNTLQLDRFVLYLYSLPTKPSWSPEIVIIMWALLTVGMISWWACSAARMCLPVGVSIGIERIFNLLEDKVTADCRDESGGVTGKIKETATQVIATSVAPSQSRLQR